MKLFPHILARVGGCTFSEVVGLSFEKISFVNVLLQKEGKLEVQFEKVLECFQKTFENTSDYRVRAILKNGKKDFQNQRSSFFKKLKKIDEEELLRDLLLNISIYSEQKLEYENLKNEFDLIFSEAELNQYVGLKYFSQNQSFQKSMVQSSHSLFHQIKKIQFDFPKKIRKKERQLFRSLAQYFYRIGAKTSPFSHFTSLDILSKESGFFRNENIGKARSFFQFNNFILSEMKIILLKKPTFFRQLKLQVNPTLCRNADEFHFIKNSKNIEIFQQIEVSEIEVVLSQKIIREEGLIFDSVLDALMELVEAERESLENYLLELIEVGFLEWQWGFSGLSFDWEKNLWELLSSKKDFSQKGKWLNCLAVMNDIKPRLENCNAHFRYRLQKVIKDGLEELGLDKIIPELIFFEDVYKPSAIQISADEIEPIIHSLDSLLRLLEHLMVDEMKTRILDCWSENFQEEKSVPLLNFYQKYFQTSPYNITSTKNISKEILNEIKSRLKENTEIDQNGILSFSTKDLENIFPQSPINFTNSYSGLFQFYKKEGKTKAVINGLTPGYGKLFGRFLPLFDKEITIQLQKWNAEIQDENLWVENVDSSIFNANLHPSFLSNEIKHAGSQNNLPLENQITIQDIEVVWEEDLKEPILVFAKTGKRITIFDFGFEHPGNRSPMYQLLNGFSLPHATYRFFLQIVNELFVDEEPNEIKRFRRIIIDDHLILQRKSQEVPHSFFPQKEKNESNSSYFLKIQKWKMKNHFPQYIFIKPIQNSKNTLVHLNKDFFKPQMIDLDSPIAIVLLQKTLEKYLGRFRLEEMLPNEEEMIGDTVAEFAVQWRCS